MAKLFANSRNPDQKLHSVASDLGLHCLPITLLESPDYNGLKSTNSHLTIHNFTLGAAQCHNLSSQIHILSPTNSHHTIYLP